MSTKEALLIMIHNDSLLTPPWSTAYCNAMLQQRHKKLQIFLKLN